MRDYDEHFIADTDNTTSRARAHQFDLLIRSPQTQVIMASLPPGHTSHSRPSINRGADQVIYIIDGVAEATVDGKEHELHEGRLLLISAGQAHQVVNIGSRRLLYLNFFANGARTAEEEIE